jgi:uncharacterized protein YcsI (UPF0317 family)
MRFAHFASLRYGEEYFTENIEKPRIWSHPAFRFFVSDWADRYVCFLSGCFFAFGCRIFIGETS